MSSREGGASSLPTATIDHDTRNVLAAHPHHVLGSREGVRVTEPNRAVYEASMAGLFPGAENLLVNSRIFVIGDTDWRKMPPMLRPIDEIENEQMLKLELELDEVAEGTIIHLWADAYQAPPIGGTRYVASARPIPKFSRLEFAFGIMQAAVLQGPVRFSVSACDGDNCEPLFAEVYDPAQQDPLTWQDRSISLASVWGQTRSLEFEAVPERAEALSLPVWANPRVVRQRNTEAPPNVILLSIDTLRRDHLSIYGYERETAPFITNRLAANGAVFENFIAEAATTEVSHMSLFTSLPALVHGVTSYHEKLAVPVMTLAEAFRNGGFDTAAFTEAGPLDPNLGFKIGFDLWKGNPNVHYLFPSGHVERIFAQAWDWIAQRRDRPFFLFLHTFQVHHPLSPPRAYRELFLNEEIESTKESLEKARYDQEIRYVDDELARFWNKLEKHGYTQNTILAITSDHGDEFWEHGQRGHGNLPYEELLGVPLVLVGPTVAKGLRSQRPLHHIDLMPTLLALTGLPIPEHALGESFAPSVRGANPQSGTKAPQAIRTSAVWIAPEGI
ncbi:MAG: sulfatase, partial [Myxococcota bacterium]